MENILVSVDAEGLIYDVKLADFGKAITFSSSQNLEGLCGTIGYMAPELVTQGTTYNHQVDVWSLGIVYFCLIAGEMPFKGESMDDINHAVLNKKLSFKSIGWNRCSPEAQKMVRGMLCKDPNKRLTIKQVMNHKFFTTKSKQRGRCLLHCTCG